MIKATRLFELRYYRSMSLRAGREVWMSHKGTVPIYPDKTAFESCLLAVERCDLFLAIITSQYGSGVWMVSLASHTRNC